MPSQPQHEIKVKIADDVLRGGYANTLLVAHTAEEFVLDFILSLPPQAVCNARVVVHPGHLKRIVAALQQNLARYEAAHGVVASAPDPGRGRSASPTRVRAGHGGVFSGRRPAGVKRPARPGFGYTRAARPAADAGRELQGGVAMAETVAGMFLEVVARHGGRPAFRHRVGEELRHLHLPRARRAGRGAGDRADRARGPPRATGSASSPTTARSGSSPTSPASASGPPTSRAGATRPRRRSSTSSGTRRRRPPSSRTPASSSGCSRCARGSRGCGSSSCSTRATAPRPPRTSTASRT